MQVLIKVYEHEFINTVLTQELIDSQVEIDEDLSNFATAKFTIPMTTIQEDNKIEIYEVGNVDKLIFTGYVYKVEPVWKQFGILNIECRSEKALMNKRLFLKDKSKYEVISATALPVYPQAYQQGVNYWLNQSLSGVYFFERLVIPPPPKKGTPPPPYYTRGFIPFHDTTFVADTTNNNLYRIEDGQLLDEDVGNEVTIAMVLDDMIDDYSNLYNEQRTYEVDFTGTISLDMKRGDNYFDVLDEIAIQNEAIRDVVSGKIIMKKCGNDYTSGPFYKEIIYNGLYPNNSNIKNINVVGTATRNNIVMVEDAHNNKIFDDSGYVDRVYGVGKNEFRSGNLYLNLQKMIVSGNKNQRTYEVEVEQNTLDVNIGDKIKLIVENTNSYFDINSDVYITKKNTIYNNGSKLVKYNVGEIDVFPQNIESRLYGIQKSMKLVKLG